MNNRAREPQSTGLNLGDIYYTVFRRKWLILFIWATGLIIAAALYMVMPQLYQSEAKVLLRYILESKTANPTEANAQVKTVDSRADAIVNAELEILTSLDLAEAVTDLVGPKDILAQLGGGTNRTQAAFYVRNHLTATAPGRGNIIKITFEHPDPEIPPRVLRNLIDGYFRRHVEIHRSPGILEDILAQQTDQLRANLLQIEDELRKLKSKAGVTTLEDTKKTFSEQINRIIEELLTAETELAERQAAIRELERQTPMQLETLAAELGMPLEKLRLYKTTCTRLNVCRMRERSLLIHNTEQNPIVARLKEQEAEAERAKSQLETEYPKLASPSMRNQLADRIDSAADPVAENTRIIFLQARTNVLNQQLARIRAEAAKVDELEPAITELQRKKNLAETNYFYYSTSLEQSHMAEARGPGKVANITIVQSPTPPVLTQKILQKPVIMAILGSLVGGLALAFLLERYVDQTVRRPVDAETALGLPLFLTIPWMTGNARRRGFLPAPAPPSADQVSSSDKSSSADQTESSRATVAPWDPNHEMRSYYDALRDRLITYFEVNNMTHKPKLLAVTGCSKNAGVSTVAAGLAASLSETGDGNVLLVDMNLVNGAAHPFFKGKPASGLLDVLEHDKRNTGFIHENLYVASANELDDRLPRLLPKRISQLVPKFKASDYDYIIFDMPMIDQRSITPRLTGLMDMTLMVIESEKTPRDAVKKAAALIGEAGGKVRGVLNKNRTYVPTRLHQDY
jgi:polysaccharide biosynthesis transport protein